MDETLKIAPAQPADVPEIVELIRELARYEKLEHQCVATLDDISTALFGEQRVAEALLARAGADAVGFALFFHNYSTFLGRRGLYLEDLFVRPVYRGRGYGRALLAHLARVAAERQCGRMEWTVLDWNAPAMAFYRSLGARGMDEWKLYRLEGEALAALAREA